MTRLTQTNHAESLKSNTDSIHTVKITRNTLSYEYFGHAFHVQKEQVKRKKKKKTETSHRPHRFSPHTHNWKIKHTNIYGSRNIHLSKFSHLLYIHTNIFKLYSYSHNKQNQPLIYRKIGKTLNTVETETTLFARPHCSFAFTHTISAHPAVHYWPRDWSYS